MTGAFSFTGGFIARRLIDNGRRVRTLTNHLRRPAAEEMKVEVAPLQFANEATLVESLRGADTLYNTYWVRFPHGGITFDDAVVNTRVLMSAAVTAGVRKVVHISVSNPAPDSPLPYYAGKAHAEAVVQQAGLPWAVVRPTLIFGPGDILINNIAWLLRRLPAFLIAGLGDYKLQPVSGEDVAEIAIAVADQTENLVVDAAGPDTISYAELVESVAISVGRKPLLLYVPPALMLRAGNVVGRFVRDVVLTREELEGLMTGLLVSHEPPRGRRRLDDWLLQNGEKLGTHYASELDRHFRKI